MATNMKSFPALGLKLGDNKSSSERSDYEGQLAEDDEIDIDIENAEDQSKNENFFDEVDENCILAASGEVSVELDIDLDYEEN